MSSVYHESWLLPRQMEKLYEAGFWDIDTADEHGRTPLMLYHREVYASLSDRALLLIETPQWLIDKGANLDARRKHDQLPARHIIALNVSAGIMHCYQSTHLLSEGESGPPIQTLRDLLSLPLATSMLHEALPRNISAGQEEGQPYCFCLAPGFSPLSMALHYILNYCCSWRGKWSVKEQEHLKKIITALIDVPQIEPEVSRADIRLLTFTSLELTHTCYIFDLSYGLVGYHVELFDQDDAAEIHEEEHVFIEELEALVAELQRKFETLGVPLWEYIQTHRCVHMREYLLDLGETVTADSLCILWQKEVYELEEE
ncbi:hypothetical protein BDW71DRAFT_209205 [Aspergillus fruticulosus]